MAPENCCKQNHEGNLRMYGHAVRSSTCKPSRMSTWIKSSLASVEDLAGQKSSAHPVQQVLYLNLGDEATPTGYGPRMLGY